MVDFLLLTERTINYSKKDIDEGNTPPEIYSICACIRETFCISYDIRKNNNLYIFYLDKKILIKFKGKKLRYLGPDERSQALLLQKALDKAIQNNILIKEKYIESTPGIYFKKFKNINSFIIDLNSKNLESITLVFNSIFPFMFTFITHMYEIPIIKEFESLNDINNRSYILSPDLNSTGIMIGFLKPLVQIFPSILENIAIISLKKINAIEDKILYINFQIDKQVDT